jgi:TetR/AcrR family transcriptional regulator, lmrAB and yxaGH operons repressor
VPRPPGDSRDRFVSATQKLLQTQGYLGTSIKDIAAAAGAPLGSLYFLFPGGKTEIVIEALQRSGEAVRDGLAFFLGEQTTANGVVTAYVALVRDLLVGSSYTDGCPIATVALEAAPNDAVIADVISQAFASWAEAVRTALANTGVRRGTANTIAGLCLAAVEGALVVARSDRDPRIFDHVLAGLVAATAQLTAPAAPKRKRS